jgi:excisionase family DNA binding protein
MTSQIAAALIAELDDDALDALAARLAPRLERLAAPIDDHGWLRGADQIAEHLGCPRSRVYSLSSSGRIPVERDGSALVARKTDLDAWIRAGGAKRP